MERIKRIGLRGSFFLLALCGLAVSLVLLALLWQGCGAIAARYSNGGYIIGPGGLVERLPSPSPEEARLLELLGDIQLAGCITLPLLGLAGAGELEDRLLPELSGGQRQRVYLAMALAQDTSTILMDEPTTYLDVSCQLEVMALARRLAEGGIGEDFYQQVRRAAFGSSLRGLNSFENIAVSLTEGYFHGYDPLRFPQVFETITKDDIASFLRENIAEENAVLSEIVPK